MWEPTKCCCCCDVRSGSIVIGVFILVSGFFVLLAGAQILAGGKSDGPISCWNWYEDVSECENKFWKVGKTSSITSIVVACCYIKISSFLLYGIHKKKTAFFIPMMVAHVIKITFMILGSVVLIILMIYEGVPSAAIFPITVGIGLAIFLKTYCLLVIRAYYYQLKREKGLIHTALIESHIDTALIESHTESPPYPVSECPPYPDSEGLPYPCSDVRLYPGQKEFPK
ncbi:hypothetical protein O3P69_002004 [Scylla paramamosain]|uniref:DUF7027 domain-containing protein n=1 Tax=Scylla paramamosain TaxID=85552 RepID=A0AAW0V7W5_SCYPA